jgi:small subunit ribosomal protein S11
MASKKLETSKNAKAKTAKKKRKINILSGVAHIHSSANNTIVAISDDMGNIVS